MTLYETLDDVSEKAFEALAARQDAVLTAVAHGVKPFQGRFDDALFADRIPDMVHLVERVFDLTAKLLANQRAFTVKLLKTLQPPRHVSPKAVRTTKAASTAA